MIVVDASVIATALGDDSADGDRARARLDGERLAAPHLLDVEVSSVWRRQVGAGRMPPRRAQLALDDLAAVPIAARPTPRCSAVPGSCGKTSPATTQSTSRSPRHSTSRC